MELKFKNILDVFAKSYVSRINSVIQKQKYFLSTNAGNLS